MVEGGGSVQTQFLAAGLADELQLVVAPFFVGDPARPPVRRRRPVPLGPRPPGDTGRGPAASATSCCSATRCPPDPADLSGGDDARTPPPRPSAPRCTLPLRFADGYADDRPGRSPSTAWSTAASTSPSASATGAGRPRVDPRRAALVRLHSECLTGDVLGSQRCDCGPQLREAVERIAAAGGYLLYLRQEGRGIGLYAKLDAYAAAGRRASTPTRPTSPSATPPTSATTPSPRRCSLALGVQRVALLSNNPDKAAQLARLGISVVRRVPTAVHLSPANARYLATKAARGAHSLVLPTDRGVRGAS